MKRAVLYHESRDLVRTKSGVHGHCTNKCEQYIWRYFVQLEKEPLAVLGTVHKFVHEDGNKLKLVPMAEDLELVYFNVARYINEYDNDKFRHLINIED